MCIVYIDYRNYERKSVYHDKQDYTQVSFMKKMYRLITAAVLITSLVACSLLSGCGKKEDKRGTAGTSGTTGSEGKADSELLTGTYNIEIDVKDYGVIKATLDADAAPITVTNFVNLVKEGFYDGLTFHRIMKGFMIQGGDPSGNSTGGSDKNIKGEFSANGVENSISHKRGVMSMARSNDYDSASSQFFIMHEDAPYLDGQYAAFGNVTEGMEVVDAICDNVKVEDDNGTTLSENQPVINSIKLVD